MCMLLPIHGGFKNSPPPQKKQSMSWPEDRKSRERGPTHVMCLLWVEYFSRCLLLCVFLAVSRNSWWSLMLNLPRCLIKLMVLYDATLLSPLECWPYIRCCLVFCCFESKIAPHYFKLANCQATEAHSCALSQDTMQWVQGPTQTAEWNMDRWCGLALSV